MRAFLRDLRVGLQRLRQQPLATTIAVLSLAIGLAAAASLTSLLDGFGFRPLAVANPEALVRVQTPTRDNSRGPLTWTDLRDLQALDNAFDAVAGSMTKGAALTIAGQAPEITWLGVVTSNYLHTLGVRPVAGRDLTKADEAPGAPPVAVLSYRLWTQRFQNAPDAIGRTIVLNGGTCTIVGIAPRGFTGLDLFSAVDVWVPPATWPQLFASSQGTPVSFEGSTDRSWSVVARSRGQMTIAQANERVQPLLASMTARLPAGASPIRIVAVDLETARLGGLATIRTIVWTLVGLIILVGCANVAGLLLGQAEARRRELAVRVALGAHRSRLVRMLLAESFLLAALACLAGIVLGAWAIGLLPAMIPASPMPFGFEFRFDVRVVAMTIGLSLATVFAFGLWPAWRAVRGDLTPRLGRVDAPPVSGLRWFSARHVLVVSQVAVSAALLVAGGLLIRGLDRSRDVDVGFERRPMLITTIAPAMTGSSSTRIRSFLHDAQDRLRASPGVASVAVARAMPLSLMGAGGTRDVEIPGRPETAVTPVKVHYNTVSEGYFDTMGTRILRGRPISRADGPASPRAAVVNRTFARQYWSDDSAVGHVLRVGGLGDVEVVGVAEDGKYIKLAEEPQPYMFLAADQMGAGEMTLIVRPVGDVAAVVPVVRSVLHELDPGLPVLQMLTLDEHLRLSTFEVEMSENVIIILGGAGLVLCVAGLYGVVAFVVARRTREFGIRLALGAQPGQVQRQVAGQSARLAATGTAIGLPLGALASSSLGSSLYGISPADPVTLATVASVVIVVALAAAWSPARRAMRTDPAIVLRDE